MLKRDESHLSLTSMSANSKIKKNLNYGPEGARGFRVIKILRACKKFSLTLNPRNPTNRKATTNQMQEIRTFSRLGLGKQPAFMRYGGSRERAPQTLLSEGTRCSDRSNLCLAGVRRLTRDRRTSCPISVYLCLRRETR